MLSEPAFTCSHQPLQPAAQSEDGSAPRPPQMGNMMIDSVDRIDLPKLRRSHPALYRIAKNYLGPDGSIHPKGLPADIKDRLDGWLVINYESTARTYGFGVEPQQPAPPPQQQPQQPEKTTANIVVVPESISKEQAAYLERWVAAKKGQPLPPAAQPVAQQPVVTAPPAPVVTTPAPPAVRYLPTGEPELPLSASVGEMRAASKEQLQDLSRRRGEGRLPRSSGWHGATF
jgi:hypothetical protein